MNSNYVRACWPVTCNKCGDKSTDCDVEKMIFKEIGNDSYSMEIEMNCKCGGQYER